MSDPFLTEIRLMSFEFAPQGWALCDGQILPIEQNEALFSLLRDRFGGDGQVNFALPDLRGRTPLHVGNGHTLGESGGEESHALSHAELPEHTHQLRASQQTANTPIPTGHVLANSAPNELYGPPTNLTSMSVGSVSSSGDSQAHQNMQPFLTLNFVIALQGIFPSPS